MILVIKNGQYLFLLLTEGLIMFELHASLVVVANMEFERNRNPNQLLVR